jgi:hypothetical protein
MCEPFNEKELPVFIWPISDRDFNDFARLIPIAVSDEQQLVLSARASAGSWLTTPSGRIEHNARPGYKIVVCDCESIEPKVLANFSGCKAGEHPGGLDLQQTVQMESYPTYYGKGRPGEYGTRQGGVDVTGVWVLGRDGNV